MRDIFFKSMIIIERRLLISNDLSLTDVASTNNLHNASISSAMSLINMNKHNKGQRLTPGELQLLNYPFNEMVSMLITCCSLFEM